MSDSPMIIGIVGTANTGKTTMINDIIMSEKNNRDLNLKWTLFGKDYRKTIEEKGLSINRNGNEECQQIIHDTLLQNILDAANEKFLKRIIMDRTILDSFAYTYWHYKYGTAKISRETLEKMWRDVVSFSKLYTSILYIPMSLCKNIKVVDDKFRDTNFEYRKQIDAIIESEFISLLGHASIKLIYGNRDERVERFYLMEDDLRKSIADSSCVENLDCFEKSLESVVSQTVIEHK